MDRVVLRQKLRALRRSLSSDEQSAAAARLALVLGSLPSLKSSQNVALYLASDGEIDPRNLVERLWRENKNCYLPVLDPEDKKQMHFQLYSEETRLTNNRFGIVEPEFDEHQRINVEHLDLVLMPLTGFDERGNRLGMGGGFYDRTFSFVNKVFFNEDFVGESSKPVLIGLAHECQKVDTVPVANWDVPMAGVATDKQFYSRKD